MAREPCGQHQQSSRHHRRAPECLQRDGEGGGDGVGQRGRQHSRGGAEGEGRLAQCPDTRGGKAHAHAHQWIRCWQRHLHRD